MIQFQAQGEMSNKAWGTGVFAFSTPPKSPLNQTQSNFWHSIVGSSLKRGLGLLNSKVFSGVSYWVGFHNLTTKLYRVTLYLT